MRVNIGCGNLPTAGWKNYDNSFSVRIAHIPGLRQFASALLPADHREFIAFVRAHGIEFANVIRHIPLADATADVVYSSHMLEHLHPEQARSCLREIKRVLRPRGIVRLNLPDLRLLAQRYLSQGDANLFMEKSLLATPPYRGFLGKLHLALVGFRHHLWMYDGLSLCKLLRECGFYNPQIMPPGETLIHDPAPLDLNERQDISVYVEAIR